MWKGLAPARWLTDYRSSCDVEEEWQNRLGAKSQHDYRMKLQNNAILVLDKMAPRINALCPECDVGNGLSDQFRPRIDKGGAQTTKSMTLK